MTAKISIGTVNFGIPYGQGRSRLQVSRVDAEKILEKAFDQGITHLDTAIGYGTSEEVLGQCISSLNPGSVNITSKLLPIGGNDQCADISSLFQEEVERSCERLCVLSLDRCLLHKASDIYGERSDEICEALVNLKRQGLVKKVGVSAYTHQELHRTLSLGLVDIVQVPFSIADQRLLNTGMLRQLNDAGVEVDVRSVFLQGVLLQTKAERHSMFGSEKVAIDHFLDCCRAFDLTPLQACLGYALHFNEINNTVLGVQSVSQLEDIIEASKVVFNSWEVFRDCAWTNEDLLNPSNWTNLGAG